MINESTDAFPMQAHRPAQRWPGAVSAGANILWRWTHCGQMASAWCTARALSAPNGPAWTCMTQTRADELPSPQTFTTSSSPFWDSSWQGRAWPTTVKVGQEATRRRRWRSALTIATRWGLATVSHAALQKLLTYIQQWLPQCKAVWRTQRFPGKFLYVHPEELVANGLSLWFFSVQHARR